MFRAYAPEFKRLRYIHDSSIRLFFLTYKSFFFLLDRCRLLAAKPLGCPPFSLSYGLNTSLLSLNECLVFDVSTDLRREAGCFDHHMKSKMD